MKSRVCVVAVIKNDQGKILVCRKYQNVGVYAGLWGLPGGGIEPYEKMEEALKREIKEEVGLEITNIQPLYFRDDIQKKLYRDGSSERLYMIYLVFVVQASTQVVTLNQEFEAYEWKTPEQALELELNPATRGTIGRYLQERGRYGI